jgi:hypothetical protein
MEAFKSQVAEYCKIDDKIKELQAVIKEFKSQEKNLHDVLLEFMCNNNLEVCNAGDLGLLTVQTTSSKASINKDTIREGLMEVLKDKTVNSKNAEIVADNAAEYIINNRAVEEKKKLKRKSPKR